MPEIMKQKYYNQLLLLLLLLFGFVSGYVWWFEFPTMLGLTKNGVAGVQSRERGKVIWLELVSFSTW